MINFPYKYMPPSLDGLVKDAVGRAFDELPFDVSKVFPAAESMASGLLIEQIRKLPGNFKGSLPKSLSRQIDGVVAEAVGKLPFPVPVPGGVGDMVLGHLERKLKGDRTIKSGKAPLVGAGAIPPKSMWPQGKIPIPLPGGRWQFIPDPKSKKAGSKSGGSKGGGAKKIPKRAIRGPRESGAFGQDDSGSKANDSQSSDTPKAKGSMGIVLIAAAASIFLLLKK